jgi:hypothetical protein
MYATAPIRAGRRGMRHKDGGAHIDPKLDRFYEELTKGEWSLGIEGDRSYDGPPLSNSV